MHPDKQRELAKRGGSAPHKGKRGFAALSKAERKRVSAKGGNKRAKNLRSKQRK